MAVELTTLAVIEPLLIGVFECPPMAKSDQLVVQRQISTGLA